MNALRPSQHLLEPIRKRDNRLQIHPFGQVFRFDFPSSYRLLSIISLFWLPLLSGCGAISLFVPYPQQVRPQLTQIDQGITPALLQGSVSRGPDRLLHFLEKARFAQILGQHEVSRDTLTQAIKQFDEHDEGALISLTDIGSQGVAFISNDNVLPYYGAAYEQIFAHHYQALNYLFLKDLNAAGVEARRSSATQYRALRAHEKEVASLRQRADDLPISLPQTDAQFAAMDKVAAQVKHSFQNAWAYYLSGLIFELRGELNDAYVDYQNALELSPAHPALQTSVLRLAQRLGDRLRWQHLPQTSTQRPSLVVFYENGFAPMKSEAGIALPSKYGVLSLAFPVYRFFSLSGALSINIDGQTTQHTQPILNVQSLLARALQEQRLGQFVRQAGRIVAKAQIQRASYKEAGAFGAILASVYTVLSESADLRSWLSLPNRVDMLHLSVPTGTHQLYLRDAYQGRSYPVSVTIQDNALTLLHVINTGQRLHIHSVQRAY